MLDGERTIEMNGQQSDLLALCIEILCDLLRRLADRAHRNDDAVRIRCAVVVKEMVLTACDLCHLCHCFLNEGRNGIIVTVDRLTPLEVDIRVLCRAAHHRMIRVERTAAERLNGIPVEDLREVSIVHDLDLLDLMRGAESVKEVDERHTSLDGDEMRYCREIHDLLHARLGEHGDTCLTRCHDILMVAENVQRGGGNGACTDVEHARQQLTCNFIHIGDHQQKPLRCCVGRRQRTRLQRPVDSTCSTGLRLHLNQTQLLSKDIFHSFGSKAVDILRHRRRGRDRIDRCHVRKGIGNIARGGISVHRLHLFCHSTALLSLEKRR